LDEHLEVFRAGEDGVDEGFGRTGLGTRRRERDLLADVRRKT
jgi:hypothetical protein